MVQISDFYYSLDYQKYSGVVGSVQSQQELIERYPVRKIDRISKRGVQVPQLMSTHLSRKEQEQCLTGSRLRSFVEQLPPDLQEHWCKDLGAVLQTIHCSMHCEVEEYMIRLHSSIIAHLEEAHDTLLDQGIVPDAVYETVQSLLQPKAIKTAGLCRLLGNISYASFYCNSERIVGVRDDGTICFGSPYEDLADAWYMLKGEEHVRSALIAGYEGDIDRNTLTAFFLLRLVKELGQKTITRQAQVQTGFGSPLYLADALRQMM
jgi:hypothetical protein